MLRALIKTVLILVVLLVSILLGLVVLYRFEFAKPPSTLMIKRYLYGETVNRQWVNLENVNPVLIHSVMMSEDGKFCAHNGIDYDALNEVIDDALEGGRSRGASTLSMQTVKNLFLWHGRSYLRKGLEMPLALLADTIWDKRRVMDVRGSRIDEEGRIWHRLFRRIKKDRHAPMRGVEWLASDPVAHRGAVDALIAHIDENVADFDEAVPDIGKQVEVEDLAELGGKDDKKGDDAADEGGE